MDKQKQTLVDAFVRKIIAATKLQILVQLNEVGGDNDLLSLEFDQTFVTNTQNLYTDLGKFIDYNDQKVSFFSCFSLFLNLTSSF